ncbi:unnamed protein product [Owenia fusiformis]|uniref:Uncharacterized protein n=1 Tax=Owenia fusiformis TaxID=6347 RepID=A0A8J1U0A7_OWEFU|nr:unnamed protein product [Owenia fusiformis]
MGTTIWYQDIDVEDNEEIIADIQRRITEIEDDLQNCRKCKDDLEQQVSEAGDTLDPETTDNLEFYNANISGLTTELNNLKRNLSQLMQKSSADEEARHQEEQRRRLEEEIARRKEEDKRRSEDMREQMKQKRQQVLNELVETERSFVRDMHLCIETFIGPGVKQNPNIDTDTLFGNMVELVELAEKLLNSMEEYTKDKPFEKQLTGCCFSWLIEDMKSVYAPYCRNHDDVLALLEKYEGNEAVQEYFRQGLDVIREKIVVFDIGSLLIKPVQRVLKYPLLLNELLKSTEDSHPDKEGLIKAMTGMTNVAQYINEYKRRKDLVFKYRQESDHSIGDKMAKISFHSLKKKTARIGMRLSTNLGISNQTVDVQFNEEELRFRNVERCLRTVKSNISLFMEHLQEVTWCQEALAADIADFYTEGSGKDVILQYQVAQQAFSDKHYKLFKARVDDRVILSLNRLIVMFNGPNQVVKKRYDKLLDFDRITKQLESLRAGDPLYKKTSDDLDIAHKMYEALNAQLKDELPQLCEMSLLVIENCAKSFISLRRELLQKIVSDFQPLIQLPYITTLTQDQANMMDAFNIAHTRLLENLANILLCPKSLREEHDDKVTDWPVHDNKSPDGKAQPSEPTAQSGVSQQSESQQMYIRQLYPPDKLYKVLQHYTASHVMDMDAVAGDLVGLIKDKDPMGGKDRWFIDNGVKKGFVPSSILVALSQVQGDSNIGAQTKDVSAYEPQTTNSTAAKPNGTENVQTYSSEKPPIEFLEPEVYVPHPEVNVPHRETHTPQGMTTQLATQDSMDAYFDDDVPDVSSNEDIYQAVYSFDARNDLECPLVEGETVRVLAFTDQEGNDEWWLVLTSSNKQGYVPANYLYKTAG